MPSGSWRELSARQVPAPDARHLPAVQVLPTSQSESLEQVVVHAALTHRYGEQLMLDCAHCPAPSQAER